MKNAQSLAAITVLLAVLVLACGGGKPVPTKYQGTWKGTDGTRIYMDADGRSGFNKGSKKVDGGGAEIDESAKTLTISLFGISETWKIDKAPDGDEMTLDGVVFTK
jgi:hypothetical protein